MTATATKRKPKPVDVVVAQPTLPIAERVEALLADLLKAPVSEQREVLELWRGALDKALDEIAEKLTPRGSLREDACGQLAIVGAIPVGYIRQQLDIRGGHCHCRSYAEALKADA